MVVNGSKCGEKPLLPFFFELWSNNKKTAERHKILCLFRRFYLFRTLSLFAVEHVLGKDEVTGSNPVSSSIFVVRKSYNRQKAQDIAHLVLFYYYILCFCHRTKSLNLTAAFS